MLLLVVVGLLAGIVTSLSPCVLPVLPVVLAAGVPRTGGDVGTGAVVAAVRCCRRPGDQLQRVDGGPAAFALPSSLSRTEEAQSKRCSRRGAVDVTLLDTTESPVAPRRDRTRRAGLIAPTVAVTAAVVLWWAATTLLAGPGSLLAAFAPQHALPAVITLLARGVLLADIAASLWRLLVGLLIDTVTGFVVGLAVGSIPVLDDATRPVFQLLRMVSPLSWGPVAIGLLGIGHRPAFFLVAAAAIWPVVLSTSAGGACRRSRVDHGCSFARRYIHGAADHRVLPSVRPHPLTGMRLALGIAWVVLVPAEMLGATSGLGYEILNARDQLAYDQVMAVILVIGVLGYLLDTLARWALAR